MPRMTPQRTPQRSSTRPLTLGTLSFAVSFAAWGLISAFAPRFREMFALSATQTALLVAVPVLLGSLLRLPMGMLADRFGGRAVFTVLLFAVAAPAWWVPAAGSYRGLLLVAFFLGIAGSAFPVGIGVGFVSRWTPAERQLELMMKCDMCYDRTSVGKRPMCATVCPSQALAYVTPERIAHERREKPVNVFQFGNQTVTTKVFMMLPPEETALTVDILDFMWDAKEAGA
jgi:ferredoxin